MYARAYDVAPQDTIYGAVAGSQISTVHVITVLVNVTYARVTFNVEFSIFLEFRYSGRMVRIPGYLAGMNVGSPPMHEQSCA